MFKQNLKIMILKGVDAHGVLHLIVKPQDIFQPQARHIMVINANIFTLKIVIASKELQIRIKVIGF